MQICQLMFQFDMIVGVSADVTCAARSSTNVVERVFHRANDVRMLPHAKIIVRAPHGYVFGSVMSGKATRVRVITLVPQNVDKNAIATFGMKPVNRFFKNCVIIHGY